MSSRAERLLACAVTFRDAPLRDECVPTRFSTEREAIDAWTGVLLHEAREAMHSPLATRPPRPYLHPVDVDTDEPGIVDSVGNEGTTVHVLRRRVEGVPRVAYGRGRRPLRSEAEEEPDPPAVRVVSRDDAEREAREELEKTLRKAQKSAATAVRREERAREAKEKRANETEEERSARLAEAKRVREERKAKKAAAQEKDTPAPPPLPDPTLPLPDPPPPPLPPDPDASVASLYAPPPPKRKRGKEAFFEHPLPHDRHLQGLAKSSPSPSLLPALLRGEACEDLEVIQGPPGTGKTRALVRRIPAGPARVLLCAPTNVGAANLYARCLREGMGEECSLSLAPDRIPPGTVVESNDPSRRVVCATVSARCGPALDGRRFDAVLVDEAAQCMEAWTWTLLRPEVTLLVLAGDVRQLPAMASSSGVSLKHERSLMERLVCDLAYDNVTTLEEQNRMAPSLLRYPNDAFYGGRLRSGPHAPREEGRLEVHVLPDAREEGEGEETASLRNRGEVEFVRDVLLDPSSPSFLPEDAVLVSPYAAQCRLLLALGSGREVHTVDSFQGREADVVVLSLVRDGGRGIGFWNDERRLVVALTRARTRLVLLASNPDAWPAEAGLTRCVRDAQERGRAA